MIELHHINKSFGNLQVLRNIDLTIEEGSVTAVVGASGAGKTTLLQVAGTLLRPDSGEVIFDGTDVSRWKDRRLSAFRNKSVGFVFQFHQLLAEFTAQENVMLPALIAGLSRSKARAAAAGLLDALGVADRATHKPAELSGGERQRIAIARALVNRPKIVFADEPTGSLDSRNRDEIRSLITEMRSRFGQTFLIVTHDPTVASVADRVVTMADGRITGVETISTTAEPICAE